jgi:predicted transcriptional regulator
MMQINVVVTEELKTRLLQIARAKKWSISTLVREALEMVIKREKKHVAD